MTSHAGKPIDLSLIMRGVFAVAVVFWHTWGSPNAEVIPPFINVPGRVSVWIFFGLSGYVIACGFLSGRRAISRAGLREFYVHRAARILPLFWLLSFLGIMVSLLIPTEAPFTWPELLASASALQWSHTSYVVGVFWTLGIEIQFYILAPFLVVMLFSYQRFFPYALIVALLVLATTSTGDNRTMLGNLQHFLVGMTIAKIYTASPDSWPFASKKVAVLAAVLGIVSICLASWIYPVSTFWRGGGAVLTDLAIAAFLVTHCSLERSRVPVSPPIMLLMAVGTIAYGIYAWHGVVLLFPWFHLRFFETLALSIVLAACSYRLLELPIMNWAKAWLATRGQRVPG